MNDNNTGNKNFGVELPPIPEKPPEENVENEETAGTEAVDASATDEGLASTEAEKAEKAKIATYAIIKPLRTYEGDIAESIRKNDTSVASVNLAEQKKKEEQKAAGFTSEKREAFAWNGVISLVSIVLIVGAIGVLGFLYLAQKNKTPDVVVPQYSIITTDKTNKIDATAALATKDRAKIIKLISDNLETENVAGSFGEIKFDQISSEQFMSLLAKTAPSSFSRALGGPWLFGFYNAGTGESRAEPFVLLGVDSFDNAFDGMLRWEAGMGGDLREIFIKQNQVVLQNQNIESAVGTSTGSGVGTGATSTSTGTGTGTTSEKIILATPQTSELQNSFEDLIIKSKNARVLKDTAGNVVLLYSFLNDKYLLITTNEQIFKEVFGRFSVSRLVR